MPKDDYIRFRCSTNLKELAEKQAQKKGMNVTEYMEYLIRKDRNNMMYVYWTIDIDDLDQELVEKIINNGLAVQMDEERLLAKVDKISIDGKIIDYSYSLEELIKMRDGGDYIQLTDDIQIGMDDVIETLLGELYEPCQDDGTTYAERIYNSVEPSKEITKLIDEFLTICMQFKIDDLQNNYNRVCKQIKDGTLEWV